MTRFTRGIDCSDNAPKLSKCFKKLLLILPKVDQNIAMCRLPCFHLCIVKADSMVGKTDGIVPKWLKPGISCYRVNEQHGFCGDTRLILSNQAMRPHFLIALSASIILTIGGIKPNATRPGIG